MDYSKLLQKSNLTARQPIRAPITPYILFNKQCRLANEGLVNFMGMPSLHPLRNVNSILQHQRSRLFPLLYDPLKYSSYKLSQAKLQTKLMTEGTDFDQLFL